MNTLSYKTQSANKETANKEWILIDAEDQILGRLCSRVAMLLRGKHKPSFTPHADCGDNVIIINAEKVRMTGNKLTDREYFSHSGYPGGQKVTSPKQIMDKYPERLIERSVKGMLPKNRLGRAVYKNMHVFVGAEHTHEAQQPKNIDLTKIK